MRHLLLLITSFVCLIALSSSVYASIDDATTFHYDAPTRALIKNYLLGSEEYFYPPIPADTYVMSFAMPEIPNEVIFCYASSIADTNTFTVVRYDIVNNLTIWTRDYEGRQCALGQGAYLSDVGMFAMGVIYWYPWDEAPPLAAGPFGYGLLLSDLATGEPLNSLDMYAMPALDVNVSWRMESIRYEGGRLRFKAEPVAIESGGFDGQVFEWDLATTVTPIISDEGLGYALSTTWDEVYYPRNDSSLPVSEIFIPYLAPNNVVNLNYFGDIRTIYHNPTGIITQVDPLGQDGIRVAYLKNVNDPTNPPLLYEFVNLFRDGSMVGPYGETDHVAKLIWFLPEEQYANFDQFPNFVISAAAVLPTLPPPPMPLVGDAQTYHYDFNTQSLIKNYLLANQTSIPLGLPATSSVQNFAVDPTGTEAIFCYLSSTGTPNTVTIVRRSLVTVIDFWTQTVEAQYCGLTMDSYSANSSTFAMSLLVYFPWEDMPTAMVYPFSFGIYNVADGSPLSFLDMAYMPFGELVTSYLMMPLQNAPGAIRFRALPMGGDGGYFDTDVYQWDGDFNVVAQANLEGRAQAIRLGTGEIVYPDTDPTLPSAESFVPYLEANNVVKVSYGGTTRNIFHTGTGVILQVEPNNLGGIRVIYLANPAATDGSMNMYDYINLYRDGTIDPPYLSTPNVLPLVWYRRLVVPLTDEFETFSVITSFTSPTAVPVSTFACAGFMPSRLVVGGQGRVTPGLANNLRDNPSATAGLLGQIPGGAAFAVVAGPVCDPAGRAWWQVVYAGITGWTVEGQGTDYFTEPMP